MKAFRCMKQLLVAALLTLTLCWGSSVQAQWHPTGDPVGAWAYSTLPTNYTYPPGHLYYPLDTAEFEDAVFQYYVLENTPSGFGPVYSDPYPKFHILSTYVYVKAKVTLPIAFGGDDGSSVFVNGTFLGGLGFGDIQIYGGAWNDPDRPVVGITIRQPGEDFDRHYINATFHRGSNFLILAGHNSIGGFAWDLRVEKYGNPHRIKDDPDILAISAEPLNAIYLLSYLVNQINTLVTTSEIAPELQNSLLVKVYAAQAALVRGHRNAETVVMNNLKALVNQVEAQRGKKVTDAAAIAISKQVDLIIVVLDK